MTGAFGIGEHAFGDYLSATVEAFNASQPDCHVQAVYIGRYEETLRAGLAAFQSGQAPHLLQVFELGTAAMLAARGAFKPAAEVMKEAGVAWEPRDYLPLVARYYSAADGTLLSFPFNLSTPILYYNKQAFARAGLDPDSPPATWAEVAQAAERLKSSGMRDGYTTSRQTWVHLENFSLWHGVEFATRGNGFDGLTARLSLNSPVHVRHIQHLGELAREGLFTYAGRTLEAEPLFCQGRCALLTTASAAYAGLVKQAGFEVGVGPLPYDGGVPGAPRNTTIGGSSFWVMNGKTREEYQGVARFLAWLSRPDVQARRHREIGYLPVSTAAYALTGNPSVDVSLRQLTLKEPRPGACGLRLGNAMPLRQLLDEELEGVWSGRHGAKAALDRAVQRGNALLEEFQRAASQ
jgi:sn-glycerol 3-phosphate transport system substrate-binding protein